MASEANGRNMKLDMQRDAKLGLKLGLAAVVAASILFSAKSVFFKLCYRYGTPPVVLQTLRGLFSLPFYLLPALLMRFRASEGSRPPMSRGDILFVAWLGFSGYYLASILDMVGLQYVTAGTERLILFIYPTLVVLFSAWIFRKRIPKAMLLPLALSYAGIALSFGGETGGANPGGRPFFGGFLVFLSAVFYALFLVGQGRMVHRFGPQRLAAGCMMVSSGCIFIQYLLCYPWEALAQPLPVLWMALFTSVFCNVLPVYLYGYGVHKVGAGKAAVVSSVGPVSTLVLAGGLLGETAGWLQWAGLALVVAGTLKLGMAGAGAAIRPSRPGRGDQAGAFPGGAEPRGSSPGETVPEGVLPEGAGGALPALPGMPGAPGPEIKPRVAR